VWLERALREDWCWDWRDEAPQSGGCPPYLYWYDAELDRFFIAQRLERSTVAAEDHHYKGYPATDADVPKKMADLFLAHGLLDEPTHLRLQRARRAAYGGKP
jgi:hypothetical protein